MLYLKVIIIQREGEGVLTKTESVKKPYGKIITL